MDQESISDILARANLALSPDIITKIFHFLKDHIGLTSENGHYEVFAALAIVGEIAKVDPVLSQGPVSCGIPLEMVLRHSVGLSKESLLEVVTRQCMKWREAPIELKTKIEGVKLAYRMYKKYRAVFEALARTNSCMQEQSLFDLMAIFWIVFLFVKNSNKDTTNTIESTAILSSLFKFIFGEVVTQLSSEIIALSFTCQFSECQIPSASEYAIHRGEMLKQLQGAHHWRHKGSLELNLQTLATNQHFMQRFLDDISNQYDKFKLTLPHYQVNEIFFLELDKTLTPQNTCRKEVQSEDNSICKRIRFGDSDQEDQDNNPLEVEHPSSQTSNAEEFFSNMPRAGGRTHRMEPMSPLARNYTTTPLTARHQNLAWVNNITAKSFQKDCEEIKAIYESCSEKDYAAFQSNAIQNIRFSISEFTPSCMDFSKRQRSIYSFFVYFIKKIYDMSPEDTRKSIFSSNVCFDSILCLAVNLFNFSYTSLQSSYRKYCDIFRVTLIQGLLPINWFGLNAEMPKNIQGFLYDLEKKILIQEIWEFGEGYDLLLSQSNYQGQALMKRLRLHSDERTQELCLSMQIDTKQITKIVNLVRFILERRKVLLKQNKIDQIIVCTIGSILSINRARNFSLEEIFNHYNKMLYSLNISSSIFFDPDGKEVDLIYYYNHVFLEQVDEIISNEEQAQRILDTPIRLERRKSMDSGIEMTPLSIKFKQVAIGAFGHKKFKRDSEEKAPATFRSSIVSSLKNMNIKEQDAEHEPDHEQDYPSPCFGGSLNRTISFGDFNQKY